MERFNIWPPNMYHRQIPGQHPFSSVVVARGVEHADMLVEIEAEAIVSPERLKNPK